MGFGYMPRCIHTVLGFELWAMGVRLCAMGVWPIGNGSMAYG